MREIKVFDNRGGIRIRFRVGGKTYNLSPIPGGKWDDLGDRTAAEIIARQIAADIHLGNFDPTLQRYGGGLRNVRRGLEESQRRLREVTTVRSGETILSIWGKYREFKRPLLAPTTLRIDYGRRMDWLDQFPQMGLGDAPQIRDWLLAHRAPSEARRCLSQLSVACCWAIESGLIESDPFAGMPQRIRKKREDPEEINPFTAQGRGRIIEAFQTSRFYQHYAPLVEFLFLTGCRPSEALGLEWRDLKGTRLTFRRTWSDGVLSPRLKTQKQRTIVLGERVAVLLREENKTDPIMFPGVEGGRIDWHNFANRAWRGVLSTLPEIDYRNPKQMRHTFISLQILGGVSPPDIARYCGNSPQVIYQRYLGASRDFIPRQ